MAILLPYLALSKADIVNMMLICGQRIVRVKVKNMIFATFGGLSNLLKKMIIAETVF